MDLTKTYPRSVKDKFAGLVMLARTLDKARALKAGTVGGYHYNCPMDQRLLHFIGADQAEFAERAAQLDDRDFETWIKQEYLAKKSAAEINEFNQTFLQSKPERGSDSERFFLKLRNSLDPSRTDITTWPELLDLDERREVPRKAA